MNKKSWQLDRRTVLRGAGGIALGIPFLNAMCHAAQSTTTAKRFCTLFFPYGVPLPPQDHEHHEDWNWFPTGEGKDYRLTKTLEPLESFRNDVTIMSGLSHPNGRNAVGHAVADIFLTGSDAHRSFQNTHSLDQMIADVTGEHTRMPSLVLSSDGGTGNTSRTRTLSYTRTGNPIPAMDKPGVVFDLMFGKGGGSIAERKQRLQHKQSMLDLIHEDTKALNRRLGKEDQRQMEEYLSSLREIERRTKRAEDWLLVKRPSVDIADVTQLDATTAEVENYIRTMFDLIYLAFRTDQTRVVTYMISSEGAKASQNFPTLALGLPEAHALSHNPTGKNPTTGWMDWGRYNQFLTKQVAYFLDRMRATPEGDGSLLDNTIVLYGSSTSRVHVARNYPLVLAGGKNLGFKHGQFHSFTEDTPFSNVHLTIAQRMGLEIESFADSTNDLPEIQS